MHGQDIENLITEMHSGGNSTIVTKELSFADVSATNLERCNAWHPGGIEDWTPTDWACALTGELGELCNVIKKLRRLQDGVVSANNPLTEDVKKMLAEEIGGTFLYLDLLTQRLGLNLADVVPYEFNRISIREGLPYTL